MDFFILICIIAFSIVDNKHLPRYFHSQEYVVILVKYIQKLNIKREQSILEALPETFGLFFKDSPVLPTIKLRFMPHSRLKQHTATV